MVGRPPVLAAAVGGAAAYVAVFALLALLAIVDSGVDVGDGDFERLTELGWAFYGSHHVPIETTLVSEENPITGRDDAGGIELTRSDDFFEHASTQLPDVAYYLVPVGILLATGFAIAARFGGRRHPIDDALAGGAIVVGYLPLVAAGALVFEHSGTMTVDELGVTVARTSSPAFVDAVVLAGLAFPLVFGAIGGFIAYQQAQ